MRLGLLRTIWAGLLILAVAGCASTYQPMGPEVTEPRLAEEVLIAPDGRKLPLRRWLPDEAPRAVILAIHGFNDYSNAFEGPGRFWADRGIATYAYDQRGFGAGAQPGIWAGAATLVRDAATAVALIRQRHPDVPLYLLGESMGGAVVLTLLGSALAPEPPVDGAILVAPAVWGRETMPFYQRWALWLSVNLFPGLELTGEGLGIIPSDNIEMLRALGADPLVLKANRVDTLDGLVTLMSLGRAAAPDVEVPTLYLYGDNEQVLPLDTVDGLLEDLPPDPSRTIAFYKDGYHMLLRDLAAEIVWRDIAAWTADPAAPLPSGADQRGLARLGQVAVGE